jgi:hypothetical protein
MSSSKPNVARERHWVCAQRLRTRRMALGLTQLDVVARLRHRGVEATGRTVSAMENARGMDIGLLPEMAAVLDCTITYLLGLTADPWAWHPGEVDAVQLPHVVPDGRMFTGGTANGGALARGGRFTAQRTHWRDPGSGP